VGFKAPEFEAAFPITFLNEGFIFVDKYGRRFANEPGMEIHEYFTELSRFDVKKMEFPRVPVWGIFDEQTRKRGPLSRGTAGYNRDLYGWSLDNSKEIAKGWILQGRTAAELAAKTSIALTLWKKPFGDTTGTARRLRMEIWTSQRRSSCPGAPYYGIQLWPSSLIPRGPRRDKESRVLDPEGQPIPRLYAAGELGSIWGYLYQGACNISEGLVFGQIAGKNAAAENPWS
jgi:hypothetical protein